VPRQFVGTVLYNLMKPPATLRNAKLLSETINPRSFEICSENLGPLAGEIDISSCIGLKHTVLASHNLGITFIY